MESPRRVGAIGVDRDDMRVLQLGQGLGLAVPRRVTLITTGRSASRRSSARKTRANTRPQLIDKAEAGDGLARLGKIHASAGSGG